MGIVFVCLLGWIHVEMRELGGWNFDFDFLSWTHVALYGEL